MTIDPTITVADDAELLRLFAEYKAAVNAPKVPGHMQRRNELLTAVLGTPAQGPAGVAVKLALSGDWVTMPTVHSNHGFDFIRSALADAQRLGCVEPGSLDLWSEVSGQRVA